jgi:uncharacterized protein (UPF0335 family)
VADESNHLERLLVDVKESLERDIHGVNSKIEGLRELITTRFDTQAARLERQGALIQTGSRWTNRFSDWSEKVDASLEQKAKQISDLIKRVERLESSAAQKPN